jgi:hypothetical protein
MVEIPWRGSSIQRHESTCLSRPHIVACVVGVSSAAREIAAGGQDVDAMVRWTSATVVRYQILGEFSGDAVVAKLTDRTIGGVTAQVTDRFEVVLQWNQQENAIVGTPVIRNFPSTRGALMPWNCPRTATGPFEHSTIVAVRDDATLRYANGVMAELRRDLSAGTLATMNEVGPCALVLTGPATTETLQHPLPVPNGMMLAMPSGQGGYTHNGKAFVIKDPNTAAKGWTYTVTPTIVK